MARRFTILWLGIGAACFMGAVLMQQSSANLQLVIQQQLDDTTNLPPLRNKPDAYMDGQPLRLIHGPPPVSHVHCLAENFDEKTSWIYRSCHFENLCFDLKTLTFVLHPSPRQQHLETEHLMQHDQTFLSTVSKKMSYGGQQAAWLKIGRGKWAPERRNASDVTSYYELDVNTVWVSYFPWATCNPGHTLWDSFLPIYTLLEMFDLLDDKQLFLTEMFNPNGDCPAVLKEWAPMMGSNSFTVIDNLAISDNSTDRLVCAKHAANGMGWLTDHGLNRHGSEKDDFANPHNVGRARTLRNFRNYALSNMGITEPTQQQQPYQITISILSSKDKDRRFDFEKHAEALQQEFQGSSNDLVRIERIALWNYTLREQVEIATKSTVFITIGGGGSSPAFFLPKGATLIVYGKDSEKFDWDLWNNYANIQVHWLSTPRMEQDIDLLVDIVRVEIDRLVANRGDGE